MIEAMAMHVPVVATGDDTGFIRHGVNGLFFRKFDPKVVGSSIIQLLDDPKRLDKMSKNARHFSEKKLSSKSAASVVAKNWYELVKKQNLKIRPFSPITFCKDIILHVFFSRQSVQDALFWAVWNNFLDKYLRNIGKVYSTQISQGAGSG